MSRPQGNPPRPNDGTPANESSKPVNGDTGGNERRMHLPEGLGGGEALIRTHQRPLAVTSSGGRKRVTLALAEQDLPRQP